ncbi:hydrolase [Streptomyces sp. SID8352]|nr:hydrolase [Streptomyces sp. SID8352]
MRSIPAALRASGSLARRCALAGGALVLVTSCGLGDDGGGGGKPPPAAPAGVTAQAGSSTSVHVMWNAADGVETYEVYRGGTKVKEVPSESHMVDITRLRPSTAYVFTVRARDAEGRLGPHSQEVRATTPAGGPADSSAPTAPGGAHGEVAGGRAVQLGWTASEDDRGVVSYDIYQGGTKVHGVGGGQTATVVTGLRPGTAYAFTVRARDAADNTSPPSAVVRLTTPGSDDGRAPAPTGLKAASHREDGAYYIDLAWTVPHTDGVVTEYQIHLDGRSATSLVYGAEAPRERGEYSFYAGEEAGVRHRVRLRAKLPDGTWGGFSEERTVTTGP